MDAFHKGFYDGVQVYAVRKSECKAARRFIKFTRAHVVCAIEDILGDNYFFI